MTNAQLEALGDAVVDEEESDEDSTVTATPVEPVKPGFSLKYLVLGFVLGIMLSAIWSMCQVLFASRLQNTAEILKSMECVCLAQFRLPVKIRC